MKKNSSESKNSSLQPQLSQKEVTPLSTLTLEELESVGSGGGAFEPTPLGWSYSAVYNCKFCDTDSFDS